MALLGANVREPLHRPHEISKTVSRIHAERACGRKSGDSLEEVGGEGREQDHGVWGEGGGLVGVELQLRVFVVRWGGWAQCAQ
jgi:hypothetical protein